MTLFADTREFRAALLDAILHARQPAPSRRELASQLEVIAGKLGAKPRKKKPAAPPPPPRVLRTIGVEEARVLGWLEGDLDSALDEVKREKSYIESIADDAEPGKSPWDSPDPWLVGKVLKHFSDGLKWLADTLQENAPVTQEDELARAVEDFHKRIPNQGDWPTEGGAKVYDDVAKALGEAKALVPKHLTKPSELGNLRKTFEAMAKAVKLMTGKAIQVPKIPNALEEADPRQLGFGFSASQRVASPADLKSRLDAVWRLASQSHPSRRELAEALYATAQAIRL